MKDVERVDTDDLRRDVRTWQKQQRAICLGVVLAGLAIAGIGFLVAQAGIKGGYYGFFFGWVVTAGGIICQLFSGTASPPDPPYRRR